MLLAAMLLFASGARVDAQSAQPTSSKADSALWLVERFFARDSFPERARHYTGEMSRHYRDSPTLGAGLAASVRVTHRALARDDRQAIFASTLTGASDKADWYLYLARESDGWKLRAVRSLAMPSEFHALLETLNAGTDLPDSLSRLRERMQLAARPDSALAAHLRDALPTFDELAAVLLAAPSVGLVGHDGHVEPASARGSLSARVTPLLAALRLGSAYRAEDYPGCLFLGIVAAADNEVGYLHAPPGCLVPKMDPELFIYVEQVSGPWYVYKTT